MFGYVIANLRELSQEQKTRYNAVYCGLCRRIRASAGQIARLSLSYDMTFLALLLMSLYEPEETGGPNACAMHPIRKRSWVESPITDYCADMNVALAYYNCLDDWQDDGSAAAKWMAGRLQSHLSAIEGRYSRQCHAIADCIRQLNELEKAGCNQPDLPANCFGQLMGQLLVLREDLWAPSLREMGLHLGRFIYLADAAGDYTKDLKKGRYNPYIAAGISDPQQWEEHLVLAMSRCYAAFDRLPLVQDKAILDNILYSGIWTHLKLQRKEASR